MLSKSEKIFDKLKQQEKATLPIGNRRTLPQRNRETKKTTKARLGLMS